MHASEMPMDELAAWVALASLRLPINPLEVVEALGSPRALFAQAPGSLAERLSWTPRQLDKLASAPSLDEARGVVARMQDRGVLVVPVTSADYPILLRRISCPPPVLWVRGSATRLHAPLVAIVGSRQASDYGRRVAHELGRGLAERGIGVVSGGARGVDLAAHEGALAARGVSIAVLGTGIDQDYPAAHRGLYDRLATTGACITEFPPSCPPRPENFPIRNRLISGVSLGVVVVEAGEKSGALITARFAVEQDREVFAVPGEIFNPLSVGPHRLIHTGARLVRSVDDVIEELRAHLPDTISATQPVQEVRTPAEPATLSPEVAAVFGCLSRSPMSLDTLIARCQQEPARVLQILLELELDGQVSQLPGQRFVRM